MLMLGRKELTSAIAKKPVMSISVPNEVIKGEC